MEFSIFFTTPPALLVAVYFISKKLEKTKHALHILNPKKPFYGSLLFLSSIMTPLSLWLWYARRYTKAEEITVTDAFSAFQYVFEENIKGGIGFASLALLLGVMVARFHASKQNAERISMSLSTTQYSNAFDHRKEFVENLAIPFYPAFENDNTSTTNANKLHSYIFSDAFAGSFRGENIKNDFYEISPLADELISVISDQNKKGEKHYDLLFEKASTLATQLACKMHNMGAKYMKIEKIEHHQVNEEGITEVTKHIHINDNKVDLESSMLITSKALNIKSDILEKCANFLPELDKNYSQDLLVYADYINSLGELLEEIATGINKNVAESGITGNSSKPAIKEAKSNAFIKITSFRSTKFNIKQAWPLSLVIDNRKKMIERFEDY